ncbi:MAG TPA: hypothetical protein VKQ36_16170, partial [Ktedonobacterales bacterium]|nr:hypothetical protein [Ktedonobacterales bacterium]
MFCLGCGSEITIRTDYCPVCGQRIGGEAKTAVALSPVVPLVSPPTPGVALMDMSDDADSSPAQRQGGEADTMPRLSVLTMQGSAHAAEAPVGGAAIGWGDLDGLAIPQDTPGRVTLAAAAALVASLFFPWLIINGQGIAPTQLGLSALLVVGAAVIVAAPALWRPRRRRQPAAALPFGLGACLLGVGIALWAVFGPFSNGLINALFSTVVVRGITSNIGTSSGNPGFQTSL